MTENELIKKMGIGWNLGDMMDSFHTKEGEDFTEIETCWKNLVTTKEMILLVKQAGFQILRLPVT